MKPLELISTQGDPDLAVVHVARSRNSDDYLLEFVDARDPSYTPDQKRVIIVSTQFGCPIACPICDAGGSFNGNLTADEIIAQIDHVVNRYPHGWTAAIEKFKIQFARMGEPALNHAVLDVLRALPQRYSTPALIPCIATIAPACSEAWFEELIDIRTTVYAGHAFQLQFSINSTDEAYRMTMMPAQKLGFEQLADFASRFTRGGPRKVGLNFALTEGVPLEPRLIADHFDPSSCCIKLTPLNPTERSRQKGFETALPLHAQSQVEHLCEAFQRYGFEVIVSLGDERENTIGSNCGFAVKHLRNR